MKFFKSTLIGLLLIGLSSCQRDAIESAISGSEDAVYRVTVGVEDLVGVPFKNAYIPSRTSAKGAITNVDFVDYDLRYIISVYDKTGTKVIVEPLVKTVDSYEPVTFSFKLRPNRDYKFVVWADFVKPGEKEDLHYDTSDLTNITCKDPDNAQINDESRDAYTISKDETLGEDNKSINLILRRPFAKLRIVTTDWDTTNGIDNVSPDSFRITYYGSKRFNNYNAITEESNSEMLPDLDHATTVYTGDIAFSKEMKYYDLGYDATPTNRTLVVDYLMTDKAEQTPIHLRFESLSKEFTSPQGPMQLSVYDFDINVPLQRNYLTTLLGNLLTVHAAVSLSIDRDFYDPECFVHANN